MKARALSTTFLFSLGLTLLPSLALADGPTATAEAEPPAPLGGFGGTLIYENSVGKGSFVGDGEFNDRPYWSMLLSIRPKFTISKAHKVSVGLRQDIDKVIIDNADSANTRNRQTTVYDTRLSVSWGEFAKIEPAFLKFSTTAELFLPTSRNSQMATKYLGTRLYLTAGFEPLSWLSLSYQFAGTKNFNRSNNYVLDPKDFSIAPISRAGGAEALSDGLVATGVSPTEWSIYNRGILELKFLEKFTFTIDFVYTQAWGYQSFPIDELSSPNAKAGRSYSDLTDGTLELNYDVTDYLGVALGTVTEQLPKTSDNKEFRFPFWDTSNGAANRQTFYLDVVGTF